MHHYTLNTGHDRLSPRMEVANKVIRAITPLVSVGGWEIPGRPGYRCVIDVAGRDALAFRIFEGQQMLLGCGAARNEAGEAAVWPLLERMYLALTDRPPYSLCNFEVPKKPKTLPWLAVVITSVEAKRIKECASWAGDFERCLTWAWLESM